MINSYSLYNMKDLNPQTILNFWGLESHCFSIVLSDNCKALTIYVYLYATTSPASDYGSQHSITSAAVLIP